jgi:SAM-dependent methyltransferase
MTDGYFLDNTEAERARLERQSVLLRPMTERLFRSAGIGPGMSVLDVGCGAGHVAQIAAELVGPVGRVLGFDRDPEQVAGAARRLRERSEVRFVEATIEEPPPGEFDAIVGRLVLQYQPDLLAAVRSLARRLCPGGVMAFVEMNARPQGQHNAVHWPPPSGLAGQVVSWIAQGFESAQYFAGLQLPTLFRGAGLTPQKPYETGALIFEGRERAEMLAGLIRSLLPALTSAGVDPAEIGIDTLDERLYAEGGDEQITAVGPIIGVWAQLPR